jgi:hypothetical protein
MNLPPFAGSRAPAPRPLMSLALAIFTAVFAVVLVYNLWRCESQPQPVVRINGIVKEAK